MQLIESSSVKEVGNLIIIINFQSCTKRFPGLAGLLLKFKLREFLHGSRLKSRATVIRREDENGKNPVHKMNNAEMTQGPKGKISSNDVHKSNKLFVN